MNETIYRRPWDYDLEHESDARDVEFYRQLVRRLKPSRVLELGCGSGRLTVPLASSDEGPELRVVGVDENPQMLDRARAKLADATPRVAHRVRLERGDMRDWRSRERFDLVVIALIWHEWRIVRRAHAASHGKNT